MPPTGSIYAIDIETTGLCAHDPAIKIVGIGIAGEDLSPIYIELYNDATRSTVYDWLAKCKLTGFNISFDGTFLARDIGRWLDWRMCSYIMFRHLATEGFLGQRWNLETAQTQVLGWPETNKAPLYDWLKANKLTKKDMHKAPPELLGQYCALDAEAAWQLYETFVTLLRERSEEWGQNLTTYHRREMLTLVKLLARSQLRGIELDMPALASLETKLETDRLSLKASIEDHPAVKELAAERLNQALDEWRAKEPPKLTKTGKISARWQSWASKEEVIKATPQFNINAKQQVELVIYDKLKYECTKFTKSGRRAVDKKILPKLGELGKLLDSYNKLVKEQGYIKGVKRLHINGILHPMFQVPGTLTGRLSGKGGLNFQNLSKTKDFLSIFRARQGYKLVDLDLAAIEPTILAEFSRDPNLLSVYNGTRPSDIYLHSGYQIPKFREIIAKYWTPETSTEESLAYAKKDLKKLRSLMKVVVLASNYGAAAPKIHATLTEQGYEYTLEEVQQILTDYWSAYKAVKRFGWKLKREYQANGGYIIGSRGRPLAMCEDKVKDVTNVFCLSGNTPVLTDSGWKLLVNITHKDLVWNGYKFVAHDGLICNGRRAIIKSCGVLMTPDHLLLTNGGWKESKNVTLDQINKVNTKPSWNTIRGLYNLLTHIVAEEWSELRRCLLSSWPGQSSVR